MRATAIRWAARAGCVLLVAVVCGALCLPRTHAAVWPLAAGAPLLVGVLVLVLYIVAAVATAAGLLFTFVALAEKGWGDDAAGD